MEKEQLKPRAAFLEGKRENDHYANTVVITCRKDAPMDAKISG